MASSGGILVPMAQRILRQALTAGTKLTKVLRSRVAAEARAELEPIPIRTSPYGQYGQQQPIHPTAFRLQLKRGVRWYSNGRGFHASLRRFISTGRSAAPRYVQRTAFLQSNVGSHAVWKSTGRAPFASTLRPNLTGGALPRTAGGYALGAGGRAGGGARFFSHTPAAPAQVVQNVSQAMRAFWLSGQRARFDGTDVRGRLCYKAVSALEEDLARRLAVPTLPKSAPGAFVDFSLVPTITALAPIAAAATAFAPNSFAATAAAKDLTSTTTLGTEGFLDVLGVDFSHALKDLTAVMNDLKRLSDLGGLPVRLEQRGTALRVRFPGVDAATVDRLCEDLGITRGVVGQDAGFDAYMGATMALRFPFAPGAADAADAADAFTSPGGSMRSHVSKLSSMQDGEAQDDFDAYFDRHFHEAEQPPPSPDKYADWDGYESMSAASAKSRGHTSDDFEGLEGVYRFLEECDRLGSRF